MWRVAARLELWRMDDGDPGESWIPCQLWIRRVLPSIVEGASGMLELGGSRLEAVGVWVRVSSYKRRGSLGRVAQETGRGAGCAPWAWACATCVRKECETRETSAGGGLVLCL